MKIEQVFFLLIGLLILNIVKELVLPSLIDAKDFVLSGYTEVGKRSTSEDYEEEDTDDDYAYQNYHLKFEQEVSDYLNYDISSFIYDKDYKDRDSLDNISRLFKTGLSYYLKKLQGEFLKLDFNVKYKDKRYKNSPNSEYDQIRLAPKLTFKKKDLYTVDLIAGIDNYDYLEVDEKDQFKIFGKVVLDRYFLNKKLMLTSSYKQEFTEQERIDRKRAKQEIAGGFDYIFDPAPIWCGVELPWIYKISNRLEWGQRDTKEEEERDQDFDYEYWRYYTKTEHKLNPKLKTALKYQYFKKDYISADLDHRGFYIQNSWDYKILDDKKQMFGFDFELEHKDVKYELKSGNDYKKKTFKAKLIYKRKKNWQAQVGLEQNFYDFDVEDNNKKRTYVKLGLEKLFLNGDLILSLDLKYRYTNYKEKDNTEQKAVRLAFKYKF